MKNIVLLLILSLYVIVSQAQKLNHVQGEIIVQLLVSTTLPEALVDSHQNSRARKSRLKIARQLNRPLNIWLLTFDFTQLDEQEVLRNLRSDPLVQYAQLNHLLTRRNNPNDAFFSEQWNYINLGNNGGLPDADIDIEEAWDITTGGISIGGDTIVIAVLDDGVDIDHEDLAANLWKNYSEIPANGIDDDNNGYIDDFNGWNFSLGTDEIDHAFVPMSTGHGTAVAGTIGAVGNNEIGIAGVNWNIKLMILGPFGTGSATDNAAVAIEAYSYALDARIKYNESNGQEGAYVVATNSSWGILGRAEDAPAWCSFFDDLGAQGILNTVATHNKHWNVEEVGDLPTTCPSEFLIGVTNSNNNDEKVDSAGYGVISIDLAAPAEEIPLLFDENDFVHSSGTSYAAPMVAGVLGLLYAAPCADFNALAKQAPNEAALLARKYLLNGVDKKDGLTAYTATGGRLNAHNSLRLLMADCGTCPAVLEADIVNNIQFEATINWSLDTNLMTTIRYRKEADENWIELANSTSPTTLTNLVDCTTYEVQLATECIENELQYGRSYFVKTIGCCEAPQQVNLIQVAENTITLDWDSVLTSDNYELLLTNRGDNSSQIFNSSKSFFEIQALSPCTDYAINIRPICGEKATLPSDPYSIRTKGCGACLDLSYCSAGATDASFEWIEAFTIGDLENISGFDSGYGDHTGISTSLTIGETYPFQLVVGYPDGDPFDELIKIWIDYNQDGILEEDTELAYDSEIPVAETISGSITIPENISSGITRLRVIIKSIENPSSTPFPCEAFEYGEVEDYCVELVDPNVMTATNTFYNVIPKAEIFPNPSQGPAFLSLQVQKSTELEMSLLTTDGQQIVDPYLISLRKGEQLVEIPTTRLPAGVYLLALKSKEGRIIKRMIQL